MAVLYIIIGLVLFGCCSYLFGFFAAKGFKHALHMTANYHVYENKKESESENEKDSQR